MGGGRFTPERSRRALTAICGAVGLDCGDAVAVKLTVNAVYRLPRSGVIVRIARSPAMAHRVEKVVTVARWLAQHDLPAVRLLPGVPAPVRADDAVGTLWIDASRLPRQHRDGQRPAPAARRTTASELADALRRLHAMTPPSRLPNWDPMDDVDRRIADAEGLAAPDRDFLREMADRVRASLATVPYVLPRTVVHGDAHLGNLLRAADGRAVLCDFDATSIGPAEWDLIPVAVGRIRFRYPAEQQLLLAQGYGFDVTAWPGFGALRALRELKLVTSVVPLLASSPAIAAQFAMRLASLRYQDETVRWYPYG
jgi:aminoglycoside phosphotransferase (APT) family kinase protein